eukprot:1318838-Heterocapsa_arctica.AAC.1
MLIARSLCKHDVDRHMARPSGNASRSSSSSSSSAKLQDRGAGALRGQHLLQHRLRRRRQGLDHYDYYDYYYYYYCYYYFYY